MSSPSAHNHSELLEEVVQGVMFGTNGDDAKWSQLSADESQIVRGALVRAQEQRDKASDPGDAYLRGLADAITIERQLQVGQATLRFIRSMTETPEQQAS